MMKTAKGMLLGMGVAAAAMLLIRMNPAARQAAEDTMQTAIDKAEEIKDSLGK